MKPIQSLLLISISFVLVCCNAATDNNPSHDYFADSSNTSRDDNTAAGEAAKEQLRLVIATAKNAMDSIDATYRLVRSSSRLLNLSLDERQQVNEALLEMNNAKDLIVLETQKAVIDQLQQKTTSLNSLVAEMNTKSKKLKEISNHLSHVCGIIQNTTNALATALTSGIIKPKIIADSVAQ